MKKKKAKILYIVLIIFIWMILKSTIVKAASTSLVATTTTPTQGQTVTVTASVTAGAWNLNFSGAGKSEVIYGFTQINGNASASKSISFVAGAPGTSYTFFLTGDMTDITSSTSQAVNKSITITVKESGGNNSSGNGNTGSNSGTTTPNTPGESNKKSNIATLKNLGIRPNDFKGFNANKLTYSTTVPYETETVEVYASKGHDKQTITGIGSRKLNVGSNKVDVTVTAEDGTTKKTYTINITRKEKGDTSEEEEEEDEDEELEEPIQDIVFGLSELSIPGINLNPEFQTDIYEYNIELKEDLDKLDFSTLLATSVGAEIEIIGNENLQEGENIITIIVKGENEEETVTYQIIVNKIVPKENEEIVEEDNEQTKKMIIIGCIASAIVLLIIIISVVVIKRKKYIREEEDEGFMKYNNINDIYKESFQSSLEDEEDYDTKNKRNKGKRYK